MSYTKRYTEVVSRTVSVSYPKSDGGGTKSVTVDVPVEVNIHVDTDPFDKSINGCNTSVNALTGSVIATEAAQIASINSNAKKVAGTIINGFFKNIRFEISTQITELTKKIDAQLMHLHELAKELATKKMHMEMDYNRTANRYVKIFEDLNNELSNRIVALDRSVFDFGQKTSNDVNRTFENDLVNTVAVFGKEGGELQAKISASITKKRALDAVHKASLFLRKQKVLETVISQSMLNEKIASMRYSPVCFIETSNDKNQIGKKVYRPDFFSELQENELITNFQSQQWVTISSTGKENIQRYFNSEISNAYSSSNIHTDRVKETIMKMFDFNAIKNI